MCACVYVLACVPFLSCIHVFGQPIFRNIENYSNNLWMRIEFSYFCFMRIIRIVFKYLFHLRFLHQFTIFISAWLRTTTFKPPRGMPISCNFVCCFFFVVLLNCVELWAIQKQYVRIRWHVRVKGWKCQCICDAKQSKAGQR